MSKRSYFSLYKSPNIVIVPTVSFCDGSTNKKTKLDSEKTDGGSKNKIPRKIDSVKTSHEKVANSTMIKNANEIECNGYSSLPVKKNTQIGNSRMKLNRLKPISPCMRNLSNLIDTNGKSQSSLACKENGDSTDKINKMYTSQLRPIKNNFNCKNTADEDKVKLQNDTSTKNIHNSIQIQPNAKLKNNTDCSPLKGNINKKSLSTINIHKKHTAIKHKLSLVNSHCPIKMDSNQSTKITHKQTKLVITDENTNLKQLSKSKKTEQKPKLVSDVTSCNKPDKTIKKINVITCGCDKETKKHAIKNDVKMHDIELCNSKRKCSANIDSKILSKNKTVSTQRIQKKSSKIKFKRSKESHINVVSKNNNNDSKNTEVNSVNKPKLPIKINIAKIMTENQCHKVKCLNSKQEKDTQKPLKEDQTATMNSIKNNLNENPKSRKDNKTNKRKKVKLIFNLVISHAGANTLTEEDNNPSHVSNSEISFLDDINIDEIVESLGQFKPETNAEQKVGEIIEFTSSANNLSITNSTEEHDRQNNFRNNNDKEDSNLLTITIEDNLQDTIKAVKHDSCDTSRTSEKNNILKQSTSSPNTDLLLKDEMREQDKEAFISRIDEDNIVEVLNDSSSLVRQERSDKKEITTTKADIETLEPSQTTANNMCEKLINSICFIEQSKVTQSSNDPLEEQLSKIFGMNKNCNDPNNGDDNCKVIKAIDTETDNDMAKTVQQIITQAHESQTHDSHETCSEPQVDIVTHEQCLTSNEIKSTIIDKSTDINHKEITDTQKYVDAPVAEAKPVSSSNVKSEVIKVTQKRYVAVSPDDNDFIKSIEDRMLVFLEVRYTVTSLIHTGEFSRIYQCKDDSGSVFAIKAIRNIHDSYYLGSKKEGMLMKVQKDIPKNKFNCVYLINGFSVCGYWCFLMEYYPRNLCQALKEHKKPFHIDRVQVLAKQLIAAVMVLRNNNIVHSDIRPSHILINSTNDILKLCGFDRSYHINEAVIIPSIGHQNYRAPEVILGHCTGFSVDVWSTALVMYEMATNIVLFPSYSNNDALFKHMCTLGHIPKTMVNKSLYSCEHFYNGNFVKKTGPRITDIKFYNYFNKSKRISKTIFRAYTNTWMQAREDKKHFQNLEKISSFVNLLEQMLVIYPKYRLPIEFAYADAFIYEK